MPSRSATDQLARLGERFHRPDGNDEMGSGLGLSIVQRIAALHGLDVTIEPRDGGRGLRVRVGAGDRAAQPKASSSTSTQCRTGVVVPLQVLDAADVGRDDDLGLQRRQVAELAVAQLVASSGCSTE